jgi:flagellar hook-associated protein 3 FlgL
VSSIIPSFSISSALRQSVITGQVTLANDAEELTTGTLADVGLTLGADTGQDVQLRSQESLLQTIETSNNTALTVLNSTASILTDPQTDESTAGETGASLQSMAQGFLNSIVEINVGSAGSEEAMQTSAASNLQNLTGQLNTNVGGQFIFGGINSSVQPMTNATSTVTSAFNAFMANQTPPVTASTITSTQMQSFLTGTASTDLPALFTNGPGGGWATNWSSASDTPTASQISPSQTVVTSVSANQSAFQQLTQAYAMVAGLNTTDLNPSAFQTLLNSAQGLVQQGITGLTNLGTSVGTAQATITDANNFMSTQLNTLSTQIGNLEDINTFTVQTQESDLQTQIETAFELTSQLQQLSLVSFLRG